MSIFQRIRSHIWIPKSADDLAWLFTVNPAHYSGRLLPEPGNYRFPSPAAQSPYEKPVAKDARRNGQDPKNSHYYWVRDSRRAYPTPATFTTEDLALIAPSADKQIADGAKPEGAVAPTGAYSVANLPPTLGSAHSWKTNPHPDVNQLPTAVSPYPLIMKE